MLRKKIRLSFIGENVTVSVSGEAAKKALGTLYERLNRPINNHDAGMAAIKMFLELFGDEITEKLLRYCEKNPEKAVRKFGKIIRFSLYPLVLRHRKYEDRRGVKKYL
ncbi:MAG: hypothetical protein FWE74_09665 [Oscillospiraceae bacterium]|nr:hypothetical protein [Oscillospiraceae bacterium]